MGSAWVAAHAIRRAPWPRPRALARRHGGTSLTVRPGAARVLCITPVLAEPLCVASRQARNCAMVASGRRVTSASIAACRPLSLGATWQRCGRAVVCPVRRRRDRTFETYDTLTRSVVAIRPTGSPSSAAANTRSRRSCAEGLPRCQSLCPSGPLQPAPDESHLAPVSEAPTIPVRQRSL